jgi:LuxR family transcriptional regulator, maltose regulon positive regulatory protein
VKTPAGDHDQARLDEWASETRSERPGLHPDLVRRKGLLGWFRKHRTDPVLAVFAPAGYGKTTLLGQAAEEDGRPVGWASLEDQDNDPENLTKHIWRALHEIAAVDHVRSDGLQPTSNIAAESLGSIRHPSVVVLDNVDLLSNRACHEIIAALTAAVPQGSQLWLGGRDRFRFALARLRAERRLAELGRDDLAFDRIEAEALLRAAGIDITRVDIDEVTRSCEGWAAGLYLTALSLQRGELHPET